MQVTFTRVFYFLDVSAPKKMEVLCCEDDKDHPTYYNQDSVPEALTHKYENKSFQAGKYKLVHEMEKCAVYFYSFDKTMAASDVTAKDLEIRKVKGVKSSIEEIFPSTSKKFPAFDIPNKFFGEPDVLFMLRAGEERVLMQIIKQILSVHGEAEGRHILDSLNLPQLFPTVYGTPSPSEPSLPPQVEPVAPPSPASGEQQGELLKTDYALVGQETMRNKRFVLWLKENLGDNFIVAADVPSRTGTDFYSRFSRSKQDFNYYVKKIKRITPELQAVAVTEASEEDYEDLQAVAGDCKEAAKHSDKNQLIANMTKTAADVAYSAVTAGVLFNTITVYGFLVDYKASKAKQLCRLVFNYKEGLPPTLTDCDGDLNIVAAVERTYAVLSQSIAVVD